MTADGLTTIAKGDSSDVVDAGRVIVRDSAAWHQLWSAHAGASAQPPEVDFSTSMVVAAFAGERPNAGYSIEIVGARQERAALAVDVSEVLPSRDAVAAQMIVTPFHIATLPRFDGPVRFTDHTATSFRESLAAATPALQPELSHVDRVFVRAAADAAVPSSTGLEPKFAAALSYLAAPFSGILILLVERSNEYVRFHAWQAILGLGGLGLLSAGTLVCSFLTLLISPVVFTLMYRLSEVLALVWVLVWMVCLVKAFGGARWHMPLAGRYAERLAPLKNAAEKH
jgi:uncharacterized membrane protein